jgi:hypothetical protein
MTTPLMLLLAAVALGAALAPVMRALRPEGFAAMLPLVLLSFGLGLIAAKRVPSLAWGVGAAAPAAMYVALLTTNDLLFWREGRLYSDGFAGFLVLLFTQVFAGLIGVALSMARARLA